MGANREWLIACDESGIDGSNKFYGFGTLWLKHDRRGDISGLIKRAKDRHDVEGELKWNACDGRRSRLYIDLIDEFFERSWIAFHCLVVPRAIVDLRFHKRDRWREAWQKHFCLLLKKKMCRLVERHGPGQVCRVWVDRLPQRKANAHEVMEIISNYALEPDNGIGCKVTQRGSHDVEVIQLCDVLLGCVLSAWQGKPINAKRQAVQDRLAAQLGWDDLRADTPTTEAKFNIWMLHPKGIAKSKRVARTRAVLRDAPPTRLRRSA
ncbi:MAG: DUF3800 domain-containing protein [Myxococcota bacterium]